MRKEAAGQLEGGLWGRMRRPKILRIRLWPNIEMERELMSINWLG
jgi:hypothetical protein